MFVKPWFGSRSAHRAASSLIPVDTNFSLYKYAPDWKDSYGRPFPDPQLEGKLPYVWTQCWDESKVTFGRVVDLCQCNNPWGRNPPWCVLSRLWGGGGTKNANHTKISCSHARFPSILL